MRLQASWAHPTPATCTRVFEAWLAPAPIRAQLALFVLRSHNCYLSPHGYGFNIDSWCTHIHITDSSSFDDSKSGDMGCLAGWLAGWLHDLPIGWLASWLAALLAGWLIPGWHFGLLAGWLAGWLPGWLSRCLTGWLTGWLPDWLAGWLGCCLDGLVAG